MLNEFLRIVFRENFYENVGSLQSDLDKWLIHYNYEQSHLGYRNKGKRPIDTIQEFVAGPAMTERHPSTTSSQGRSPA